jgi:hypothetical protein
MAVASEEFKKALQLWASGVAVVTSQSEKYGVRGMTVTIRRYGRKYRPKPAFCRQYFK